MHGSRTGKTVATSLTPAETYISTWCLVQVSTRQRQNFWLDSELCMCEVVTRSENAETKSRAALRRQILLQT
jgi:hypothetical protein